MRNSRLVLAVVKRASFGLKKFRFRQHQLAFLLKQAEDGTTVEEACRNAGISIQAYYRVSALVDRLECIAFQYGRRKRIRDDPGPEFISKDRDLWAHQHEVVLDFSWPGKTTDNAFAEQLNDRFTAESLKAKWFLSPSDAKESVFLTMTRPELGASFTLGRTLIKS